MWSMSVEAGGVHGNRPPVLCNEEEREEVTSVAHQLQTCHHVEVKIRECLVCDLDER